MHLELGTSYLLAISIPFCDQWQILFANGSTIVTIKAAQKTPSEPDNTLLLSWVKPVNLPVASKPSHLSFGIAASISLHGPYSLSDIHTIDQMLHQVPVTQGLHALEVWSIATAQKSSDLLQKSLGHHFFHSPVDTFIQFGARTSQPNFQRQEWSILEIVITL